jgi:hypothetical protein
MTGHGPHGDEHGSLDRSTKLVGLQAAVLAVFLALVTISSHRAHTESIVSKNEASNQWSYFQSKRIKHHLLELGGEVAVLVGAKGEAATKITERYEKDRERYNKESEAIKQKAEAMEEKSKAAEHRAARFDIAEGLIEIGVILTSLYFLSKSRIFPLVGLLAGVVGVLTAASGFLLP